MWENEPEINQVWVSSICGVEVVLLSFHSSERAWKSNLFVRECDLMCPGPASKPPTWSAFMSLSRKRSTRTSVCLSWLISAHTAKDSLGCSVNIYCTVNSLKTLYTSQLAAEKSVFRQVDEQQFISCCLLPHTSLIHCSALMFQGWRGRVRSVPVSDQWCQGRVWKIVQRVQGGLAKMGALHRHRPRPTAWIGKKLARNVWCEEVWCLVHLL